MNGTALENPLRLPSYLEQSPAVAERFQRLKQRPMILEVDRLTRIFTSGAGEHVALRDVSFKVHRREFVCVIGPSGCGKSTLIRIIAGLEEPSSGRVLLEGSPVSGPGSDRGMVFQGYTLFPWLSVKGNVMFGLRVAGKSDSVAEQEARQWIELVGLSKFEDVYPHQLSGGMKQRVAIARALANNPRILIMDEPFGALDAITREQLNLELLRMWHHGKQTVIFITHDITEAVFLADRVLLMSPRPGTIAAEFPIPLPRPRILEMRFESEFTSLCRAIHQEMGLMRHDEQA
jgi:NitT/TauT family transport system ATP-binding protein